MILLRAASADHPADSLAIPRTLCFLRSPSLRKSRYVLAKCDRECGRATLSYSNGQTEGQINKLKLVKRAMYGRGKFDLLRQRLLHAA